jgi:hypothetical protein
MLVSHLGLATNAIALVPMIEVRRPGSGVSSHFQPLLPGVERGGTVLDTTRITTCGRIINALAQLFLLRRFATDARNRDETRIVSGRSFAVRGGGAVDIRQGTAHLPNTWSDTLAEPALAATPHRRLRM